MSIRALKRIIPPVLLDFIKRNAGYVGKSPWRYVNIGFEYPVDSGGWDLEEIAKLQFSKWDSYKEIIASTRPLGVNHESSDISDVIDPFFHNLLCSFAYVLTLSGVKKTSLKFLDWGGGIGHYGLLAEELLKPAALSVNYYCYDFEIFGKYGNRLNQHFTFFADENKYNLESFDLIMASSSIWYERDWRLGVDKLIKYKCEFLYITRMIFIEEKPSYVAIQTPSYMGYETEYLFWVINRKDFLSYVEEKGFTLLKQFEFGEVTPIFKAPEQGTMKGFLFKSTHSF